MQRLIFLAWAFSLTDWAAAQDAIVAPGAALKQETTVGASSEGPAWHPDDRLLFSGAGRITRLDKAGRPHIFRENAGTNGLLFDLQGRLLACESRRRRVTRTEPDGSITVLADQFDGKRFNTPNDLTIDTLGRIYFSDPRYGDRGGMEQLDAQGRAIEGVYRIDPDGTVRRIISHEVERPNGVLVAPDGRYLYVADNHNNTVAAARKLWRFDLTAEGAIQPESKRLMFDWRTGRGPDGMCIDRAGRLYVAAGLNSPHLPAETADEFKGGVYVLSPEGKLLQFIPVPADEVTNCELGGDDLRTLYITAGPALWSIRVTTPGQPGWPRVYEIARTAGPLQIDGRLDEPAWSAAAEAGSFCFPWWKQGHREPTAAKLLWDDQNLYVAFRCSDAHIWGENTERDSPVYQDDCVEVFTSPNPDQPQQYFNIEMNVKGAYLDFYHPGGPATREEWNPAGIRIATTVQGTLNNDGDTDDHWILEAAIPLASFSAVAKHTPPQPGDMWRMNLNRLGGKTNPQHSQWSAGDPQKLSFHAPPYFGRVIFVD